MRDWSGLGAPLKLISRLIILTSLLVLAGCATFYGDKQSDKSAKITTEDLLSGRELFGAEAVSLTLPEDGVLEMSPEMRAFLDQKVPLIQSDYVTIRSILTSVVGSGGLNMDYNKSVTYTAREAFRKAEGNCLGFSYLIALMARERGLRATFQEVEIPPDWTPVDDRLIYANRHVNVRITSNEMKTTVVDIDRVNVKPYYKTELIGDQEAEGHYYSNLGAEYLDQGDMKNAFRYFAKAIRLAPGNSQFWSNLGVFYRLNEKYNYAERAYFIALARKRDNYSALNNLHILYDLMGEPEKAAYFEKVARDYQMKNPYYRYYMAKEAYEEGNYDVALSHLREIINRKIQEPRFYTLMADTYAALGEEEKAAETLEKKQQIR
ncbi:tetratricopeptide repeat protein [Emcibacter nanhaiensis]|uniref:Uncharacterized protein n=1 Tax=Emcibacter nanhaiensis TaxID=1505037 RepID=A0A501PNA0_9PROT|nr:tetratricopeptide repeat protein [Emcibacter nanhaiensis]TPD61765.1 hypothetical protein FIV46_06035 [Emcibacter nanhaiensis]